MKLNIKTRHIILNSILVICSLYIILVPVSNVTNLSSWPRVLKALPAISFIVFVWYMKRDVKRKVHDDERR